MVTFQNLSKSLLPISQDVLFNLCDQYHIDPGTLPSHGKLTDQNYPLYVADITGHFPCPICNGVMGRVELEPIREDRIYIDALREFKSFKSGPFYSKVRCMAYPIHSIIKSHHLVRLCEHGYYVNECKDCLEVLYDTSKHYSERA